MLGFLLIPLISEGFWMFVIESIVISITASIIFLLLLFLLRPWIKISKKIAFYDGKYWIKTINRSYFRLFDVKFQLTIKHPHGSPGGMNVKYTRLELRKDTKLTYPRRLLFERRSEFFEHAVLVAIDDDIRAKWSNESDTLEFIVIAKHGLSSFSKIFKVEYKHLGTDIAEGKFKYGNNMDIIAV